MEDIRVVNIVDKDFSEFVNSFNIQLFDYLKKLFKLEGLGYIHHELILSTNYFCYKATRIFNNTEEIVILSEFYKNCTLEELNKDIYYLWLNYLTFNKFN